MQGVIVYSGRRLCELAKLTGNADQVKTYTALLDKMTAAAWASQAWLTLAVV